MCWALIIFLSLGLLTNRVILPPVSTEEVVSQWGVRSGRSNRPPTLSRHPPNGPIGPISRNGPRSTLRLPAPSFPSVWLSGVAIFPKLQSSSLPSGKVCDFEAKTRSETWRSEKQIEKETILRLRPATEVEQTPGEGRIQRLFGVHPWVLRLAQPLPGLKMEDLFPT